MLGNQWCEFDDEDFSDDDIAEEEEDLETLIFFKLAVPDDEQWWSSCPQSLPSTPELAASLLLVKTVLSSWNIQVLIIRLVLDPYI